MPDGRARRHEHPKRPASCLPDDMRNNFVEELASLLETRAVAIEPPGISSAVRIEVT